MSNLILFIIHSILCHFYNFYLVFSPRKLQAVVQCPLLRAAVNFTLKWLNIILWLSGVLFISNIYRRWNFKWWHVGKMGWIGLGWILHGMPIVNVFAYKTKYAEYVLYEYRQVTFGWILYVWCVCVKSSRCHCGSSRAREDPAESLTNRT